MSKCVVNVEIALQNNRNVIVSREREGEGEIKIEQDTTCSGRSICMQIMLGHWVSWFMANNEYNYTECIRKLSSSRARSLDIADNWLRWSISWQWQKEIQQIPHFVAHTKDILYIQCMSICIETVIFAYISTAGLDSIMNVMQMRMIQFNKRQVISAASAPLSLLLLLLLLLLLALN